MANMLELLSECKGKKINSPRILKNKIYTSHSNDSHQCPILAADFFIFYYGTENEEAIQAGAGSE